MFFCIHRDNYSFEIGEKEEEGVRGGHNINTQHNLAKSR